VTNSWPKTCFNSFSRWKRLHFHQKIHCTSLLYDGFNWATPGQAQPAACNYLEFLLWCNEATSSR